MKILVFSPYYPPHIGGLENHADEFNKYLSQAKIDIVVFTPRLPKDSLETDIWHDGNVKVLRFPAFEIIPNFPLPKFLTSKYWKLKKEIKKEKFDIVISRTRFFFTSAMAGFFAKRNGISWLHIEHGSDFPQFKGFKSFLARFYDYTLGKWVLRLADNVVANSQASADFIKKLSGIESEVIYRGVETEIIESNQGNEEIRKEYTNKTIIIYLGRLITGKGVSDLIQALSQIKKDYILLIIGNGPERKILEKLSEELRMKDKTILFGQNNHETSIGFLKSSDILVNPSYTEGLPTSVVEGALCRKAIIATNVGGTPEIITDGKSGFLINPRDIKSLKNKLELLMNDKNLRSRLGNSAYEEIKNKFNWKNNIQKYLDLFPKIINSRKKIFFLSSRHGGPMKQHRIIADELKKLGYKVEYRSDFFGWIKAHFIYGKNKYVITNVPLLARLSKKNFIFNIKGNYRKEKDIFKNPLGYLYEINKLWSERIVFPSNYLKNKLKIENAIIIPNAVSEKLIEEGRKERVLKDNNEINLIMVTMFGFREKAEGALKVIKALANVKTEKNVTLSIFGKGTFEDEIKDEAQKINLPENIKVNFRGYTKNINEEYWKSDIFVYWSDLDVMPNVFLEAMAFGLPIVANNFPSFTEIIGDDNFIAKNENDFTNSLENFINNDRLRKKIGKINKQKIVRRSINEIIKEWEKIL